MQIEHVLLAPVVTEKATGLAQQSVYSFQVHLYATKDQITSVVEKLYKVKVDKVRIVKRKGKTRRVGKRMQTVQIPDKKIAYITVKEGTIDIFPKT